jgi:DNA-binding NtrC family response regulator
MSDFSSPDATILLLVSDPVMRDVLHDALADAGYLVTVASELGAAVDRLREMRPDLLITRPYINSMTGQIAADYLRTKRPGLPILIVTGYMDDERIRDQNAIDEFHIFPRSFTRDEFLNEVRRVLAGLRKR